MGNLFQTPKYPQSSKETVHFSGDQSFCLLYWLMSFSILQAKLYCSIQRSGHRDRSIVIGTYVLVNAHLHLRATETVELYLVSDVHRLSSIPIVPESRKAFRSALRSFSSARNRIEDHDMREIASAASEHVLSSFVIFLRRDKSVLKSIYFNSKLITSYV